MWLFVFWVLCVFVCVCVWQDDREEQAQMALVIDPEFAARMEATQRRRDDRERACTKQIVHYCMPRQPGCGNGQRMMPV